MGDDDDAPVGTATLRIGWMIDTEVPSGPSGSLNTTITDVRFRMENLHATLIIDPTNPLTTKDEYKLHWDNDSSPESIKFDNAPPGHYSSVVLQLDDGDGEHAFELLGTYDDPTDGTQLWEIESDAGLSITMDANLDLEPEADVTLMIQIDVKAAVTPIDFTDDDQIDDSVGDRPLMDPFRAVLQQSTFRVAGISSGGG